MTTFYLDYVNGNDAADGSTFALGGLPTVGPWKTITSGATAARIAPGDVIRIAKSPDPTSLGQTAAWTNLSKTVTLQTGAVTLNIDLGESAWNASTNVTATADTTYYKQGTKSAKLAIAAGFTTGLAARIATGTLDLSGYQQLSFWVRNDVAFTAGQLRINLCSDVNGGTPVNSFDLPAIPSTGQWVPITIDYGSALYNSVKSVALYVMTDFGAVNIWLDNIIACKAPSAADSLTLQSLISKNSAAQGGTEYWYPIQSINGTTILIDNGTNTLANAGRGYSGTTETVTTYKRETIKTAMASASTTVFAQIQDSGSSGSYIEFQGGYNTGTNSQDGETIFDGLNGWGYGLDPNGKLWVKIKHLHFGRFAYGSYLAGAKMFYVDAWTFGNTNSGISFRGSGVVNGYYKIVSYNNIQIGIDFYEAAGIIGDFISLNNINDGIRSYSHGSTINSLTVKNNGGYGITGQTGEQNIYKNITSANNASGFFGATSTFNHKSIFKNATVGEAGIVVNADSNSYTNARYIFENFGGVATDHRTYTDWGNILSETSVRHTASGFAWKLSPTNAGRDANYPLNLKIAEIAVNANTQVTVSLWMRRTNTGITGSLVCRGGQIAGVDSDVKTDMTAAADTWEQVQIQFTPTAAGVVEIEVLAYGGTTYSVYVDDLSVSQA
jgi:hypothetical protein